MLATGGSAIKAIDVLIEKGCSAENIVFLNLFASPEGTLICVEFIDSWSILNDLVGQVSML
jgi:uracil phosphoribosyltransferase